MTAIRIEIDEPCVVSLTCDEAGRVRQEVRAGERVIHVAEFSAVGREPAGLQDFTGEAEARGAPAPPASRLREV